MWLLKRLLALLIVAALAAVGAWQLVEAQAHGESLIFPLTLLALPLISLGWLVVRIGSVVIRGWKWGGASRQKTVVGLLTVVLAGAALVVAVQATVPSQRPSAQLTAALASACRGGAVAGAGALDTSGSHMNHLVVLDADGNEQAWTGYPPIAWRPLSLSDTELVACISDETRTEIQVCDYVNGPDIHRYRVTRTVRIVEAATGRTVVEFTVSDEPRSCHATEQQDVTELSGELTWEMVAEHCAALVETGVYRPPTPDPDDDWTPPPDRPTGRPQETPRATTQPPEVRQIALAEAMQLGLVDAKLHGDGLQNVVVELESLANAPLEVEIALGTMLEPARSAAQTMVVTVATTIDLEPGESGSWDLPAACAKMRRDEPGGDDLFTISRSPATGDLARLLAAEDFAAASARVQQFAVWTITNDPARSRYVGLGSTLNPFGSGPSDEEFAAIRELILGAGIEPRDYRAFR
jgi:hypothetical protein